MNILYISPVVIDRNNLDGVARKVLSQCKTFASYDGVDSVYLASYFEGGRYMIVGNNFEKEIKFSKKSSRQLELFEIYPMMPDICSELNISAVYFRILALSWVSDRLFKDLGKLKIKIVVEIPTYPFWKEKWSDVLDKFRNAKFLTGLKRTATNIVYWFFTHQLKRYIETIVTFSDISSLWGVQVIGIANGYNFEYLETEKGLKSRDADLNILMVASVRRNHGADRVIKGLSTYYKSHPDRKVKFHIVGDGDAVPELHALVNELTNVNDTVIFHGFKAGEALDAMYEMADVGISAIGFHRLGVRYASPLKSKEYFAKGIPVVGTTVEHDVLKSSSSSYYMAIGEDDSEVNIQAVCDFYDGLKKGAWTNRKISIDAENNFAWKSIMRPIYDVMK